MADQNTKTDLVLLERYENLLRMKPVYDRLCQIAEAKLMQAAEAGAYEFKYFKITKGRRSRDWNADADTVVLQFGEDVYETPTLLSVYAAEKKFGRAEVRPYVKTSEGELRLVPKSSILNEVSINATEFN